MCPLIGEVQQRPEFEAWVAHGNANRQPVRQRQRFFKSVVLIDVKYAPDLVVSEIFVFVFSSLPLSRGTKRLSGFHQA
jgi:hypothetical protein